MSRLDVLIETTNGYPHQCGNIQTRLTLKSRLTVCLITGNYKCSSCSLGRAPSKETNLAITTGLLQGTSE